LHSCVVQRTVTDVSQCGYRLWNGTLLLCEYILTNPSQFLNKTILEGGARTSLCTLITSRFASNIFCNGKLKFFPLTNLIKDFCFDRS